MTDGAGCPAKASQHIHRTGLDPAGIQRGAGMNYEVARPQDVRLDADEMAASKFLIRYKEPTVAGYRLSLKQWFQFCADHHVRPLEAERAHIEVWIRDMES